MRTFLIAVAAVSSLAVLARAEEAPSAFSYDPNSGPAARTNGYENADYSEVDIFFACTPNGLEISVRSSTPFFAGVKSVTGRERLRKKAWAATQQWAVSTDGKKVTVPAKYNKEIIKAVRDAMTTINNFEIGLKGPTGREFIYLFDPSGFDKTFAKLPCSKGY